MVVKEKLRYGFKRIIMNAELHTTTDSLAGFASPHDQALISETEYNGLRKGILPTYARKWIVKLFGGVPSRVRRQLVEAACEEPYHPQIAISIVFGVIASHKSLEKWKAANLRKSYQSISVSRKVDGKWHDLETCLWPPYESPATRSGVVNNTVYHRPARYIFKHGNIRVDLGTQDGRYSPIQHNNPNSAMQSIATRLGRSLSGDWVKVAQKIVGNDDLIATSTSMRVGNQWIVLITMMRDPKITPASYHVGMEGNVISADGHHPASSVSEVEYALIKGIIEEEDDHACGYSYEFDEEHQAQIMVEAMSDRLDADTMTPTELLVMELAAENEELIDFMSGAHTFQSKDYHDLLDMRVEQTALQLINKYKGNINKAFYVARMMHMDDYDALEATQAYCASIDTSEKLFTMKGSTIHRKRFFGVPSAYHGDYYMPSRNPFSQTKFLSSVPYGEMTAKQAYKHNSGIQRKLVKHEGAPSGASIIKRMKVPYNCEYVDAYGNRDTTPAKKPTQFSLQDHPRLAAIVSSFALTGSLPKALKVNKRKESFA